MMARAHRIGAVFYVLWGLLHVVGGAAMLQTLHTAGGSAYLEMIGTGPSAVDRVPAIESGLAEGVFGFHAFNLVWWGLLCLVVAVRLIWSNSRVGCWINLAVAGAADLGMVLFLLIPGYLALGDAMAGIGLLLLAATFTFAGQARPQPV